MAGTTSTDGTVRENLDLSDEPYWPSKAMYRLFIISVRVLKKVHPSKAE
jgi:hypothetical protein